MADFGSNAGREICLATGLGRSLLVEAVFFGFCIIRWVGVAGRGERRG